LARGNSKDGSSLIEAAKWFEEYTDGRVRVSGAVVGNFKTLRSRGYDLGKVKRALISMKLAGLVVTTPMAVERQSPSGESWLAYANPAPPPLWDSMSQSLDEMPPRI